MEQAADGGPHGLPVVGVDAVPGQDDARRHRPRPRSGSRCRRCRDRVRRRTRRRAGVPARTSASGRSTGRQTATMPCGVTVSAERVQGVVVDERRRGDRRRRPAYRAAGGVRSRRPRPRSRGRASASVDGLGPSARKSRRSVRTERRLSFRASLTRPLLLDRAAPALGRCAVQAVASTGALTSSGRAALATSTSATNAGRSLTARSARILRSTSTPARRRPWMNRL